MKRNSLAWMSFCLFLLLPSFTWAIQITPSEKISGSVVIREQASASSEILGSLQKGEFAELLLSVPYWYKIKLQNGTEGFVSKRWTNEIAESASITGHSSIPFSVHFVDVGVGDAIIINIEDKEIVIDGGNYVSTLSDYAEKTGIVDGPVELAVVTHSDYDHWCGLAKIFNSHPPLEFWEPGYNRDCNPLLSYNTFLQNTKMMTGAPNFHRPLQETHIPATQNHQIEPFTIPSLPDVKFTLLHSDQAPSGPNCAYQINNASIVMLIEISGVKFLFTGDANGKDREDPESTPPQYVEKKLLDLEAQHPGILKADVLKVPHHGSETANTSKFIAAVNPTYAIISASTKHHLPKPSVVRRYESDTRIILRTDADREKNNDHIICTSTAYGQIDCNYKDQLER